MHQTKKGNQWYFGMKVHIGVDKDSGLIHSVVTTAANVHDLTKADELLHGDEEVVYGDAGYQGIAKRSEMAATAADFRVAMRPGKRRVLPDTPEGRLQDLIETACSTSTPLAGSRQSSWPVRGTDRPPVVAGDNRGAMALEATRKLSHPSARAIASTGFC